MATAFVPYILLAIIGVLLVKALSGVIDVLWTILMSSYSLSLPGILWGGGSFNFPTFIPPTAQSPMAFYYWFFVIGIIMFCVFVAVNAFRHLSLWGKFDEQQEAQGTNFWYQFRWLAVLIIMTILTPILIWIVYSIMMLGVYFLMSLIGKSSMFKTISSEEFLKLKDLFTTDLKYVQNLDLTTFKTCLDSIINNSDNLKYWLTSASGGGLTSAQATEYIKALEVIRDEVTNAIQNPSSTSYILSNLIYQAQILATKMDSITYTNPLTTELLSPLVNAGSKILGSVGVSYTVFDDGTYEIKYSFYTAWGKLFSAATTENGAIAFKDLAKWAFTNQSGEVLDVPDEVTAIVQQWSSPKSYPGGIFGVLGYGTSGTNRTTYESVIVLFRLTGKTAYIINIEGKESNFVYTYLMFNNGQKIGLQECPLKDYLDTVVGETAGTFSTSTDSVIQEGITAFLLMLGGQTMVDVAPNLSGMWPVGVGMAIAGWLCIMGGILMIVTLLLPLLIKCIVWIFCARIIIMPLFGLVIFVWSYFIEAIWYFFLLLPAIGAQVLDTNGKESPYKAAWRNFNGRMFSILLLWCGLLMMFVALFQITSIYDTIWNGVTSMSGTWNGESIIAIDLSGIESMDGFKNLQSFLGSLTSILQLKIVWSAIVKFVLVALILNSTLNFIERIGTFAFGDVYQGLGQKFSSPMSMLSPSLSKQGVQAFAGTIGKAKGISSTVSSAATSVGASIGSAGNTIGGVAKTGITANRTRKADSLLNGGTDSKGRTFDQLSESKQEKVMKHASAEAKSSYASNQRMSDMSANMSDKLSSVEKSVSTNSKNVQEGNELIAKRISNMSGNINRGITRNTKKILEAGNGGFSDN